MTHNGDAMKPVTKWLVPYAIAAMLTACAHASLTMQNNPLVQTEAIATIAYSLSYMQS
jgi:hypothetical protein